MNIEELKSYWQGFPEAPYSNTFKWIDAEGYENMLTVRGWSGLAVINATVEAQNKIAEIGGKSPASRLATPSAPKPDSAAIAVSQENPEIAKALQADYDAVPLPPNDKKWITFDADVVKILPQPDDKVTIEFFESGRQYAGVKVNKWSVSNASGLMKHVTSEPMNKAAEYKLHCRVFYTEGKEGKTTDGKTFHYKDVAHVRPI